MPKLWATTIETHRHEVRAAVVQATAALVAERGLSGVNMSAIANGAGIGRATLYKYFPDVDAIIAAWHEDQVAAHVARLREVGSGPDPAADRLKRVLATYAEIKQHAGGRGHGDFMGALHSTVGLHTQHSHLRAVFEQLIGQGAIEGGVRGDVAPAELAAFALSALEGATFAHSRSAAGRLVQVVIDALAPKL